MATRQTRLYYNTGFKMGEVPDSPTLLNSCSYLDLESHWDYQDYFLSSLDVKATWDEVKNADYLKYGNGYYFITGISMINNNNAKIHLELDGLTTLGGPLNLNYNGGIVKQAHTRSDSYLGNTIEPGIGCSEILTMSGRGANIPVSGKNIVASTLDLSTFPPLDANSDLHAYTFNADIGVGIEDKDAKVIVPISGLEAPEPTIIGNITTAGFAYFDYDNSVVKTNIKYLRDLGIEGALLYSYVVPNELFEQNDINSNGRVLRIRTGTYSNNPIQTNLTDDYSGNYNNLKTYTTYSKYVLQSTLGGDTRTFDVGDICDPNTRYIDFNIMYDGQYGGGAYCFPVYYKGISNSSYNLIRGVKSAPWKDFPIVFNTASGLRWTKNNYALSYGDANRSFSSNIIGNTTSGNVLGSINNFGNDLLATGGNLFNTIGKYIYNKNNLNGDILDTLKQITPEYKNLTTKEYNIAKSRAEYFQSKVIAPDLSCSPALGLQNIIEQQFLLIHLHPTSADLDRIDRYYTMYGYPMGNRVFEKNMLTGRRYFNYIEVSDLSIVRNGGASNAGIVVRQTAEAQLNAGVRIWHTLPQEISSNPIV